MSAILDGLTEIALFVATLVVGTFVIAVGLLIGMALALFLIGWLIRKESRG